MWQILVLKGKEKLAFNPPLVLYTVEALNLVRPIIEKQFGPTEVVEFEHTKGVAA
jgi:hypothetical protein